MPRALPQSASPVAIGERVAGKYLVEKVLAAGGMGIVVAARHETLGQPVAVKFLLPGVADAVTGARFLREARAAARIESEHVARVFDCGTLESGVPYMVMEFLVGNDVAYEIRKRGPLPVIEAVDFAVQALEGIAHAHALGIVHRDIKPSNLFIATRNAGARQIKLLDFGISKLELGPETPVDDDLTNPTLMLGSPRYMAPEQVHSSKGVDGRADLWSLGVVLYEMLSGMPPFSGRTMGEILGQVLLADPTPIPVHRPDVPEALSDIVQRCLKRDRLERFRNAGELAVALAPFASPTVGPLIARICGLSPVDAVPPAALITSSGVVRVPDRTPPPPALPISTFPPAMPADATIGTWATSDNRDRSRKRLASAVAGVIVLGCGIGWGLAHYAGETRTDAATSIAPVTSVEAVEATATPPPPTPPPAPVPNEVASSTATSSEAPSAAPRPAVKPAAHAAASSVPASQRTVRAPRSQRPTVGILDTSD